MFLTWTLGYSLIESYSLNVFNFIVLTDSNITMKTYLFNVPIFFFSQVFFLVCLSVWARAAGPRFRVDQIFTITWKEFVIILAGYLVLFSFFFAVNMFISTLSLSQLFFNHTVYFNCLTGLFWTHIYICSVILFFYINFLVYSTWIRPLFLSDSSAIHLPYQERGRLIIFYNLYSLKQNFNIFLLTFRARVNSLSSLTRLLLNINWPEREMLEMFGVMFKNKLDNRHLLLDYFFIGFPLLQTFTLSGLQQIEYNIFIKNLTYVFICLWEGLRI